MARPCSRVEVRQRDRSLIHHTRGAARERWWCDDRWQPAEQRSQRRCRVHNLWPTTGMAELEC
eukprot:3111968-Pleurochrysis_carterae.AAC.2